MTLADMNSSAAFAVSQPRSEYALAFALKRREGPRMSYEDPSTSELAASDEFLDRFLPGSSEAVVRLRQRVALLNSSQNYDLVPAVLVRGETGAGKNHLSRVIAAHRRWRLIRSAQGGLGVEAGLGAYDDRFIEIHMPALPDTLMESELFGHRRGAFTGADRDKRGILVSANIDDILLDEIGDISLALQTKLLSVIERRRFRPLGSGTEETVSARLFMATNSPLERMVREGKFREDLYHRMRAFVVRVPSLRQQAENIESIARELEGEIQRTRPVDPRRRKTTDIHLSDADIRWARTYDWPGNVRELRDAITRWFFEGGRRTLQQVVDDLRAEETPPEVATTPEMDATIIALVKARLDSGLEHRESAPGTLNDFVKEFERAAKRGLSHWYRHARPTDEQLRGLFPAHRTLTSVKNKLSQWRKA